jgi:hypothetical protein
LRVCVRRSDEVQKLKAQVSHLRHELNISNTRLVEHGLPVTPGAAVAPGTTDVDMDAASVASSVHTSSAAAAAAHQAAADLTAALTTASTAAGGAGINGGTSSVPTAAQPTPQRTPRPPRLGQPGQPNLGELTSATHECTPTTVDPRPPSRRLHRQRGGSHARCRSRRSSQTSTTAPSSRSASTRPTSSRMAPMRATISPR